MSSGEPVMKLRGAGVAAVDVRRLGLGLGWLCVASLAVASVLLFVAGAHRNSQIDQLREQGAPVTITITRCQGLLGGSGSNPVGYDCTGTYVLGGRRYSQHVPDGRLHAQGAKVRGVAVPGDPLLLSTPGIVAGERATAGVYVLPAVLAVAAVGGAAGIVIGSRRRGRRPETI
ncbi:MAG: hypothetical protein ACYDA2_05155 [Acidimicrobiales bacterium]